MQDIVYVGLTIVFFLLCAGYVRGLDRLVRAGDQNEPTVTADDVEELDNEETAEVAK